MLNAHLQSGTKENLTLRLKNIFDTMENKRVYALTRHTSASGMSRVISFFAVKDNNLEDITYLMGDLLGYKQDKKHWGLKVNGCGMDMQCALVMELSGALYDDNYLIKKESI